MVTTLKDLISDDVAAVFLVEDDFAETITYYPQDNRDRGVAILAICDLDHEEGTNQVSGDGADLNDGKGERERRTAIVEIEATLVVSDGDSFKIRDEMWFFKRNTGRDKDPDQDSGLQSLRLIGQYGRHTRTPRLRTVRGR